MTLADITMAVRRLAGRIRDGLRNEKLVAASLAVLVGLLAGGAEIVFRQAYESLQKTVMFFSPDVALAAIGDIPWWLLLVVPATGGLLVGLFTRFVMPGGRPQGIADVIEASALSGGRISFRTGMANAVGSGLSLGFGASVGREGPLVHLGATIASAISRRLGLPSGQARTLFGAGVAGAIAASFNAPIAGVIFGLEVVIGHYAIGTFVPVVVAAVTATIISHWYYGDFPAFSMPPLDPMKLAEFPGFVITGILAGLIAVSFSRIVLRSGTLFAKLPLPVWARPGAGGLMLGIIALGFPQVLGVGYAATDAAMAGEFAIWMLAALVLAKMLATAITLGSGFYGGVFAPSLFIGAMLGAAMAGLWALAFPDVEISTAAWAVAGMGAVGGAVMGAPLSTIMMIFELTRSYDVLLAVMLSVVIASLIARDRLGGSYFHSVLAARGTNLRGGREVGLLKSIPVTGLIRRDVASISVDAPWLDVIRRLRLAPYGSLLVTGEKGRLEGMIVVNDLASFTELPEAERFAVTAGQIAHAAPAVRQGDHLGLAMQIVDNAGETVLPVICSDERRSVVGILRAQDVLLAYHRAILHVRAEEAGEVPHGASPGDHYGPPRAGF